MTEASAPPPRKLSLGWRVALAASLLLAEYLTLSLLFDAQTTMARGGIWNLVGAAGSVAPLIVVAATALLLMPKGRWGLERPLKLRFVPSALAGHLLFAASFFFLTSELFGKPEAPSGPIALWLGAWLASGLGSAICLFLGVLGDLKFIAHALLRASMIGGVLGLLAYLGGLLSKQLWSSLSTATFQTVHGMLSILGYELSADVDERVLGLDNFRIQVAPVCSGVEGLGLFLVLILGFLFQFRKTLRFPNAWLLVPIGMAVIWFGNAARISALMLIGAHVDPDLAIGSFHSKAGWVAFCGITILLSIIARRSSFFSIRQDEALESTSPATPLLLPLLVWIAIGMVTSAFATGHDPLYGVRVLACGALLLAFRREYRELLAWPSLLAWAVGIFVGVLWLLLPTSAERVTPGEAWSDPVYFSWLWLRTIGTVLIVPLCEELAFRGFLVRFLTKRDFLETSYKDISWLAILVSSLAFGLLHGRILLATATGVLYALVLKRTNRLIDPIAAHAASNAVIAAYVLSTGHWEHF